MNILPVNNVQTTSNTNFQAKKIRGLKLSNLENSMLQHDRFSSTEGNSVSTLVKKIALQTKWIEAEENYLKEVRNRLPNNYSEKQEYLNYRECQRIENTINRMKFELENFKNALASAVRK